MWLFSTKLKDARLIVIKGLLEEAQEKLNPLMDEQRGYYDGEKANKIIQELKIKIDGFLK